MNPKKVISIQNLYTNPINLYTNPKKLYAKGADHYKCWMENRPTQCYTGLKKLYWTKLRGYASSNRTFYPI